MYARKIVLTFEFDGTSVSQCELWTFPIFWADIDMLSFLVSLLLHKIFFRRKNVCIGNRQLVLCQQVRRTHVDGRCFLAWLRCLTVSALIANHFYLFDNNSYLHSYDMCCICMKNDSSNAVTGDGKDASIKTVFFPLLCVRHYDIKITFLWQLKLFVVSPKKKKTTKQNVHSTLESCSIFSIRCFICRMTVLISWNRATHVNDDNAWKMCTHARHA